MTFHFSRPRIVALLVTLLVPGTIFAIQRAQAGSIATEKIFQALALAEGQTVCEVGAGDGVLSIAAAKAVGPNGRVYMHGISADSLSRELKEAGLEPVASELGSERWFMVVVSKPAS